MWRWVGQAVKSEGCSIHGTRIPCTVALCIYIQLYNDRRILATATAAVNAATASNRRSPWATSPHRYASVVEHWAMTVHYITLNYIRTACIIITHHHAGNDKNVKDLAMWGCGCAYVVDLHVTPVELSYTALKLWKTYNSLSHHFVRFPKETQLSPCDVYALAGEYCALRAN